MQASSFFQPHSHGLPACWIGLLVQLACWCNANWENGTEAPPVCAQTTCALQVSADHHVCALCSAPSDSILEQAMGTPLTSLTSCGIGINSWETIWHRGQFDTGDNLTLRTIWHRTIWRSWQFDTWQLDTAEFETEHWWCGCYHSVWMSFTCQIGYISSPEQVSDQWFEAIWHHGQFNSMGKSWQFGAEKKGVDIR